MTDQEKARKLIETLKSDREWLSEQGYAFGSLFPAVIWLLEKIEQTEH